MESTKTFNLNFRPQYYPATDAAFLANVKGQYRRRLIEQAIRNGEAEQLPPAIFSNALSPSVRALIGSFHPSFLGGEFLPHYRPGQIEIARVVLDSVTVDVTSIRAQRWWGGIYNLVEDEYGTDFLPGIRVTSEPLTLGELIKLIETTSNRATGATGLVRPHWQAGDWATPEEAAAFVRVSSPFYPELEPWYENEAAVWLAQQRSAT